MKLDRHGSKNGAETTVVFEEINSFRGDGYVIDAHVAVEITLGFEFSKSQLLKVEEIAGGFVLNAQLLKVHDLIWIYLKQSLEYLFLKCSVRLHMPGLRDRRFEWDQNDSTGWPGTYLLSG